MKRMKGKVPWKRWVDASWIPFVIDAHVVVVVVIVIVVVVVVYSTFIEDFRSWIVVDLTFKSPWTVKLHSWSFIMVFCLTKQGKFRFSYRRCQWRCSNSSCINEFLFHHLWDTKSLRLVDGIEYDKIWISYDFISHCIRNTYLKIWFPIGYDIFRYTYSINMIF